MYKLIEEYKMGNHQISEYAKYVILSDKSKSRLKGTYSNFLNFKEVMGIVTEISHSDKSSFIHNGNIYSRRITTTEAQRVVENVTNNVWGESTWKLFMIASQLCVKI